MPCLGNANPESFSQPRVSGFCPRRPPGPPGAGAVLTIHQQYPLPASKTASKSDQTARKRTLKFN